MSLMQFIGVVLVVWAWIVSAVCLCVIVTDWLAHRRDSKIQQAARLLQLWHDGLFKRVL